MLIIEFQGVRLKNIFHQVPLQVPDNVINLNNFEKMFSLWSLKSVCWLAGKFHFLIHFESNYISCHPWKFPVLPLIPKYFRIYRRHVLLTCLLGAHDNYSCTCLPHDMKIIYEVNKSEDQLNQFILIRLVRSITVKYSTYS